MTSHLVETVREIPFNEKPSSVNVENSGFPFDDRDFDRDRSHSSFRSQLDDIAKRHPEFAEHLNIGEGFPFRSHTLGRHRRGSDTEKPSGSQDAEFRRQARDRPFSRFNHLNFPFRQYFEEDVPDFYEAGYRIPERHPYHAHPSQEPVDESQQQQTSQPNSPQPPSSGNAEKPPQVPQSREGARKQNIQQSNTVDLGQRQEPVDETRGQRSMSAPPENRSTGQRFVSSINIPIQRPNGGGSDMGAKASTQPQDSVPQHQSNKPNERVIPIHVEGRDEPIIPKNVHTTFTSPPPQPQPERVFGRNPSHFTQFLNKDEPHVMTPDERYRQQQQQYQKQQQQNFQQQQQQQQQEEQQNQETPQTQPPTEPSASSKQTQLDQIQNIQKDVSELMNQVAKFDGKPKDKQYLYLDEMLTRNLIKLDNIETEGKDNIRQARKEAIKCIEGCIGILEAKANANVAAETQKNSQTMDVETTETNKPQEEVAQNAGEPSEPSTTNECQPESLEVSGVSRTGSATNVTPMEVAPDEVSKKEVLAAVIEPEKAETPQKSEEKMESEPKKEEDENDKKENTENPRAEELAATDATSQNLESKDKEKEKKKGKKKEKIDK